MAKKKKSKVVIIDKPPSLIIRFGTLLIASLVSIIPIVLYFGFINAGKDLDYRSVLSKTFIFKINYFEELPKVNSNDEYINLLLNSVTIQIVVVMILIAIIITSGIIKLIFGTITRGKFQYFSVSVAEFIKKTIYGVLYIRAELFRKVHPFMFYTSEEVENRSIKSVVAKSFWITIVIFAASFQFAGLFFFRAKSFPELFGIKFTIIDASVTFMVLTGSFWFALLLGIDLLERFDVKILDLSSDKLTNIGKIFGNITRKSLSFLTISFFFLAVQDFQSEDWIQTIVFLDLFYLIGIWVLLAIEANLEELGNKIRHDLDKRTLAGAERMIIKQDKTRLGEAKIKEAEKLMAETEARVKIAEEYGFFRVMIDFFFLMAIVPIIVLLTIGTFNYFNVEFTNTRVLTYEVIIVSILFVSYFLFQFYLQKYNILRTELLWFPVFYMGHMILHYYHLGQSYPFSDFEMISSLVFDLLWFLLVYYNIQSRAPGNEFFSLGKKLSFFIIILVYWSLSLVFQLWLFTSF